MSELNPKMPADLNQFTALEANKYANGVNHIYGVDEQGKKTHLKGGDVLTAYGYTDVDLPSEFNDAAESEPSLYDEYLAALRGEGAIKTVRELDRATGKMVSKEIRENVHDMSFNDWQKARTSRAAARWYTATRAHGETLDVEAGDDLGNGNAARSLADREDSERLNEREGKQNPTDDDINYYRWLKTNTNKSTTADDTGNDGGRGGTPNGNEDTEDNEDTEPSGTEIHEVPLTPELQESLDAARTEFVRLSALRGGKIFGKKKALAEAKRAYDEARNRAGAYVAQELELQNATPEEIHEFNVLGRAVEQHALANLVCDAQIKGADGKRLKVFYDFWARQGGKPNGKFNIKGNLKKAAAMTAITFIPGVAIGMAGAAIIGGAIGGAAAGGLLSRGIARGLFSSKVNNEAEARTVAAAQRDEQVAKYDAHSAGLADQGYTFTSEDVSDSIQELTDRRVRRNQRRLLAATAIGAASAAGGAWVGQHVSSHFFGGGKHTPRTPRGGGPKTPAAPPTVPPAVPKPPIDIPKPTDSRLPWTHVTGRLGHNGTPAIFEAVRKGHDMGIDIVGRGRGLTSVTYNGRTFTDTGHINAALDYIMNQQDIT